MNRDLPLHPDIYERSPSSGALRQGELITGLRSLTYSTISEESTDAAILTHDYALILSQDCDLDWDFPVRYGEREYREQNAHKLMQDVLFCIVSPAQTVRNGFPATFMNKKKWESISKNMDERFHFFQLVQPDQDAQAQELPELVADFKLYFSIPTASVYKQIDSGSAMRRCVLKSPYLEHYAQRYCSYQGRIALPSQHESVRGSS